MILFLVLVATEGFKSWIQNQWSRINLNISDAFGKSEGILSKLLFAIDLFIFLTKYK